MLLLFLAKEVMAVTDVPEAAFRVEICSQHPLFSLTRTKLIPRTTSLSQISTQLLAYRVEANARPFLVFCMTCWPISSLIDQCQGKI